MTVSTAKLEGKLLDKSAQVGVDQTKSWINCAAKAKRRAQVVRHAPKRLVRGTKQNYRADEAFYLGNVG